MKKQPAAVCFLTVLLLASTVGLLLTETASANPGICDRQYLPELTIKGDGSITPDTGFIIRTGNTYTLTADIEEYSVVIECSNIMFDGAGYTIHASPVFSNSGLELLGCNNVTIYNIEVIGDTYVSIFLTGSDCLITSVKTDALRINSEGFNTVTESNLNKLTLWGGNNNLISKCNISRIYVTGGSGSNTFTQNNLLFSNSTGEDIIRSANFWDNGSMGNYWGNYLQKFPSAREIGNTGIGDTPYMMDQNNIDHHPLMYPYDIEKDQIALSEREPLAEPETAVYTATTVLAIGVVFIASIVGAVAGLLYYQKKHKRV